MSYVPEAGFLLWLREEVDVNADLAKRALAAAEQTMRGATMRIFDVAGDTATARTFEADRLRECGRVLLIDDCVEVTAVNGASLVDPSEYRPRRSRGSDGEIAWPYDELQHVSRWTPGSIWRTMTVIARWGWPETPPRAIEATSILAKDIVSNRDVMMGLVGFPEAGVAAARANPFVQSTIAAFRGPRALGIA